MWWPWHWDERAWEEGHTRAEELAEGERLADFDALLEAHAEPPEEDTHDHG